MIVAPGFAKAIVGPPSMTLRIILIGKRRTVLAHIDEDAGSGSNVSLCIVLIEPVVGSLTDSLISWIQI